MANDSSSSSMMKHHQEPSVSATQMSYHLHHHHLLHHGGGGGGGDGGGVGGSTSSPSVQLQRSAASSSSSIGVPYDGKGLVPGVLESSSAAASTRFQSHLHGISEWTPEEQAILEEGLNRYSNESNIVCYAKIAVLLKNKTVRDVALHCKWMTKRDSNRRRKDDLSSMRKNKERKEKFTEPSSMSSRAAMQGIDAVTWELLRQNAQAFEQISANLTSCQIQNNVNFFCQARDNISQILKRMDEPPYAMKRMPPLPFELNEDLANAILPNSTLPMQ